MTLKSYITYISALLLLICSSLLTSCSKEEIAVSIGYPVEVNVTDKANTKITTNGTKLYWEEGDKLSLFATGKDNLSTASAQLQLNSIDAGSSTGKFKGEISLSAEPQACYFTYPNTVSASLADSKVSAIYDFTSQDASHKPFLWGKATYPDNGVINCALSHIGGMIELTNIPAGVSNITVKGNNQEKLSPVTVNLTDGTLAIGEVSEFSVNVEGSKAYICMPPVNFSKGFSIVFNSASGNMYKSYSSDGGANSGYDFSAGTFITIDAGGVFTGFDIASNASYNHTTSGGFLTGTQVIATPNLQGAPSKVTSWRAELIHPDGSTVVRTISSNNNFSATTMNVSGDWIYLPAGTYTYKSYYSQYQGAEIEMASQAITVEKATDPVNLALSCNITHNFSGGILTGSTASVTATNNSPLPVSSWSASLTNSSSTTVRSTVGNTSLGNVTFSGTDYLSRQKPYTLTGTCIVKGDELKCANTTVTAPNPNITVVSNFETSYTRYLAGNISDTDNGANVAGTGTKVMNLSVKVNVSEELLASYENSLSFTYDGYSMLNYTSITTATHYANQLGDNNSLGGMLENGGTSTATIINQSQGQHTIAASFTFDGVTTTAYVLYIIRDNDNACHITGIPYESPDMSTKTDLTSQITSEGWILKDDAQWKTGGTAQTPYGLQLYYFYNYLFGTSSSSGWVLTPTFTLPSNVNIKYYIAVVHSTTGIGESSVGTLIYDGITTSETKTKTNSQEAQRGTSNAKPITEINRTASLSASNNPYRVSISHNDNNLKSNRAENFIILNKYKVEYN